MKDLLSKSKVFIKKNASTILTTVGGVGVVATSVMAVKATPKALQALDEAKEEKGEDLTKFEAAVVAGPAYIPSIVMGTTTIACIFGANILNKRHQASLMSAYALVSNSYKEYRDKVEELYGEGANDNVQTEIAKDKYDEDKVADGDGEELFYDEFSKRYFKSTKFKVQEAEYYINRDLIMMEAVPLNAFYGYLGIDGIDGGDEVGWSTILNFDAYWQVWIDFSHCKFKLDDGTECTKIYMLAEPDVEYLDYPG